MHDLEKFRLNGFNTFKNHVNDGGKIILINGFIITFAFQKKKKI